MKIKELIEVVENSNMGGEAKAEVAEILEDYWAGSQPPQEKEVEIRELKERSIVWMEEAETGEALRNLEKRLKPRKGIRRVRR